MSKPPYRMPVMATLEAVPWNGARVASTFAGVGGSSLGYRWAGFAVVWANESDPQAQASYRLNFPDTRLDPRDVRLVRGAELLEAAGVAVGELEVLDGSPPCTAFSGVGLKARGWGRTRQASGVVERPEELLEEYVRLVREVQPQVCVAENVPGLAQGMCKGYFKRMMAGLTASGYRMEARLLDAQWLGVPQVRRRLVMQGVRRDLDRAPAWPQPLAYRYTIAEALEAADVFVYVEDGGGLRSRGVGRHRLVSRQDCPMPTVQAQRPVRVVRDAAGRGPWERLEVAALKRLCGFPDDFQVVGPYGVQWARLGNAVPPPMMAAVARTMWQQILAGEPRRGRGEAYETDGGVAPEAGGVGGARHSAHGGGAVAQCGAEDAGNVAAVRGGCDDAEPAGV